MSNVVQSSAAVIVGEVTHSRVRPSAHEFRYPLFCLRLPLAELSQLEPTLAVNRAALLSFQERDHGARDGESLQQWIDQLLREHHLLRQDESAHVELVSFPRVFGFVFNPVSFWVCRDQSARVFAVLAEVNNTFGESHRYLLTSERGEIKTGDTLLADKLLHVSPFNEVRGQYSFRFNFAPDRWLARIDYDDGEGRLLHTHIGGEAKPLTRSALRSALFRFPLQSFAVVARIHWHALRLWIKRVPFHGKLNSKMTGVSRS
ncbi:MAG: DUF1365 domain-containing protein [Burkholderiales bacterium]|nr:MAG: DUF1365 domain-containing protein [Betaproteobacteria bacterium]TAG83492.1 MAG: DUF1365 domain-containing protein [Burkholderiales bacterium]